MYSEARRHFKKADPLLYRASLEHEIPDVKRSRNVFKDLVRAIANQQLSGKAAETIFGRLEGMVRPKFTPPNVLKLKPSRLRACGLSNAKVTAIRTLSKAALDGTVDLVKIHLNDDSRVVQILTSLKGIGPWTAEMILMFSLGRRDVFSKGDLGLRKGIMRLYGLKDLPSDRTMDDLSRKWSPYRTYAARILWSTVDVKPSKD